MHTQMEQLLHYTWKHRFFPLEPLRTTAGEELDVVDTGLHNFDAGPDFFNAKVKIGGRLWAGNVEIHERASDWYRHGHDKDAAYNNTILHVVATDDGPVKTLSGRTLPQLVLAVPEGIRRSFEELRSEEHYPPCYRIIPRLPLLTQHAWLSALTTERLEQKTLRIGQYLERTGQDWERAFFIALARNFGFSVNSEAFEQWALGLDFTALGKHRDDALQVEAFFFGQAGLLEESAVPEERRDDHYRLLLREYRFLQSKFGLRPMAAHQWKMLRLRPQNFPCIRLSQLAGLYHERRVDFSRILEARTPQALRTLLRATATPYWQEHYAFGKAGAMQAKTLQEGSLDLLIINTVAPVLFAYGRTRAEEELCERAFELLETTKAERNFITRSWAEAGIRAEHAADSQALIQLKREYCDRKDCLRCRFGTEYLKPATSPIHS